MARISYTQSPGVKNTHRIEDLLEVVRDGKQGCVDGVVKAKVKDEKANDKKDSKQKKEKRKKRDR